MILRVAVLAAATLLFESAVLRYLSVAQFYHFAFLVVSLALLGLGISGSVLSVFPRIKNRPIDQILAFASGGFAVSVILGYLLVNFIPFDSYSIAWDLRQIAYLLVYLVALTTPFFFSGLGIGAAISVSPGRSHRVYGANLLGSAAGVLLGLLILRLSGVLGAVIVTSLMGLGAAYRRGNRIYVMATLAAGVFAFLWLVSLNFQGQSPLGLSISPYKGLYQARQYPGAQEKFGGWNEISRIDLLSDVGVRKFPGLSYTYTGNLPEQLGIAVDGDNIQPVTLVSPDSFALADYLPEAIGYSLARDGNGLVLEPGGGLGVLQALNGGAGPLVVVSSDPQVIEAIQRTVPQVNLASDRRVQWLVGNPRAVLAALDKKFQTIYLPLTDNYRPVVSGAYSLSEEHLLTVEALESMLARLDSEGIFITTRWLQTPPSEEIRLVATTTRALEELGMIPSDTLVVYRSLQTVTILARPSGWRPIELAALRKFLDNRKFDLVWAPDINPGEVNRYSRLEEPAVYLAVKGLLEAPDTDRFLAEYPFAVDPPTDDHPYFYHFFEWAQAPQVAAAFGRVWQPFGGSGYFVLLIFLLLMGFLSILLIFVPLFVGPGREAFRRGTISKIPPLLYFSLLGAAFLFIEVGLIDKYILLTGQAVYAFALVVSILLVSSGIGSLISGMTRVPAEWALLGLLIVAAATIFLSNELIPAILPWPPASQWLLGALLIIPLGLLMGMPFPNGLAWLEATIPDWIPWAWAINGCASVVCAVLAAILALDRGFNAVLLVGLLCYGGAFIVFFWVSRQKPTPTSTQAVL